MKINDVKTPKASFASPMPSKRDGKRETLDQERSAPCARPPRWLAPFPCPKAAVTPYTYRFVTQKSSSESLVTQVTVEFRPSFIVMGGTAPRALTAFGLSQSAVKWRYTPNTTDSHRLPVRSSPLKL